MRETILSVLPGPDELQRLVVVHRFGSVQGSELVLRQESWSHDVGWFTQCVIPLSGEQIAGLRATLGSAGIRPGAARETNLRTIRIGA